MKPNKRIFTLFAKLSMVVDGKILHNPGNDFDFCFAIARVYGTDSWLWLKCFKQKKGESKMLEHRIAAVQRFSSPEGLETIIDAGKADLALEGFWYKEDNNLSCTHVNPFLHEHVSNTLAPIDRLESWVHECVLTSEVGRSVATQFGIMACISMESLIADMIHAQCNHMVSESKKVLVDEQGRIGGKTLEFPKGIITWQELGKVFSVDGGVISSTVANALLCGKGNEVSGEARARLEELGFADEANEPEEMAQVLHEAGYRDS